MNLRILILVAMVFVLSAVSGCKSRGKKTASSTTGWKYNDPSNGGFQYRAGYNQPTGPGLVFIEGGTFYMGRSEEDVMQKWNNMPRRVSVNSFYMDETEVRNIDYKEYMYWINRVYPEDRAYYEKVRPDSLVWRSELAYNEPYVQNYFTHPAYAEYPVVGVSWEQAVEYCKWRTDRVNEHMLAKEGVIEMSGEQSGESSFTTEAYTVGKYTPTEGKNPVTDAEGNTRRATVEDGYMNEDYRLPTEAEWEYAALGILSDDELIESRNLYSWSGSSLRVSTGKKKNRGKMQSNFVRGRGDYMGTAGDLNDGGAIPIDVSLGTPNQFGLYNMSGNVNEWVLDVYRAMNSSDVEDFQPYRGNVFTEAQRTENGELVFDEHNRIKYDTIRDVRNYRDGDSQSQIVQGGKWLEVDSIANTSTMYVQAEGSRLMSSNITDKTRVYKGGSFLDRAYWLVPGARRYLDQAESRKDIGFRCAMTRMGSVTQSKKGNRKKN
ncbi:MAG: SUMF1/EgtB/PvdO family nonheme iron enzyme [Bacteroidales bacterium]